MTLTRRRLAYGLSWLILVIGATTVPMPFFSLSPGSVVEVGPLVVIEGAEVTALDGETALLAVIISRPSVVGLVATRFDNEVDVLPVERFLPPGEDRRDYFARQAAVFDDAFTTSAAVAVRAAGHPVGFTSRPQVVQVLPGSPADGVLQPGDLVIEINDVRVDDAESLVRQSRRLDDGDLVELLVDRDGTETELELRAGTVGEMTRPGLGISIDTTTTAIELPFDVHLEDGVDIGGPSAGLMVAVTIYDLVSDEDLLAGRSVTGTGTLELDGRIGRIGSIEQKVYAAQAAGYSIFLAPASQAAEAQAVANAGLTIIGVETFDDALAALRNAPGKA